MYAYIVFRHKVSNRLLEYVCLSVHACGGSFVDGQQLTTGGLSCFGIAFFVIGERASVASDFYRYCTVKYTHRTSTLSSTKIVVDLPISDSLLEEVVEMGW